MRTRSSSFLVASFAVVLALAAPAVAQADIIVADMGPSWNWGSANNIAAFSVATNACNIGNANMLWDGNTNQHPVIATNMFRLKAGRMEQLGQAWVKHGFASLNGNFCGTCQSPGIATFVGVNCSDPYGNQQNGVQVDLAPKSEVNAATGYFPIPYNGSPAIPPTTGRRLQARHVDLDPAQNAGAIYFIEVHYVAPGDIGQNFNNASYRRVNVAPSGGSYNISFSGANPTQAQKPAIQAWKDYDPNVAITNVDVPGDGRLIMAFLATANGNGTTRYEYAVHNLCSDRSVQALSIAMPPGASVTNVGFKDVDYHSNEPGNYSLTDWSPAVGPGAVSWSTQTYAVNPAANALRWGTMYNYWFDSDLPPGNVTFSLFKPGTPATIVVPTPLPAFTVGIAGGAPATMEPNQALAITANVTNGTGQADTSSGLLYTSLDGGPFSSTPLSWLGNTSFGGSLPATAPFRTISWYVSLTPLGGGSPITAPSGAPAATYTTESVTAVLGTVFADSMETVVPGWTVSNGVGLTDGAWDAAPGIPLGGGDRGDPPTAAGGSGKCFLTDNVDGDSDVDGGETRLDSPAFDLSGYSDARIRVRIWYDNLVTAGSTDVMLIQLSGNNGASWTTMETWNQSPDLWLEHKYRVGQFMAPTSQMKVRFVASDFGTGQVIEAGVDDFVVEVCPVAPYLGVAGAGNVGAGTGGPFNVLTVNGSTGGFSRRVNAAPGQTLTFAVSTPPGNGPSNFAIFGMVGIPAPTASVVLPLGIGNASFLPCPIDPFNPVLLTLADNFPIGACPALLPSTTSLWSMTVPGGVPFAIDVTLQGVIEDVTVPTTIAVTNGVILRVQ
jgi:hypothetical protein